MDKYSGRREKVISRGHRKIIEFLLGTAAKVQRLKKRILFSMGTGGLEATLYFLFMKVIFNQMVSFLLDGEHVRGGWR